MHISNLVLAYLDVHHVCVNVQFRPMHSLVTAVLQGKRSSPVLQPATQSQCWCHCARLSSSFSYSPLRSTTWLPTPPHCKFTCCSRRTCPMAASDNEKSDSSACLAARNAAPNTTSVTCASGLTPAELASADLSLVGIPAWLWLTVLMRRKCTKQQRDSDRQFR